MLVVVRLVLIDALSELLLRGELVLAPPANIICYMHWGCNHDCIAAYADVDKHGWQLIVLVNTVIAAMMASHLGVGQWHVLS